jgi:hypothetical protein
VNQWLNPLKRGNRLQPGGYGPGSGAHRPLLTRDATRTSDLYADHEATVNACGVTVARPQRQSWAPILPNGAW